MTMDSWYETQRNATKEDQRKKLEATSQLHNYRGRDIPVSKKREPLVSPKFANANRADLPPGPDARQEDVRGKDVRGIVTSMETTKKLPSLKDDNDDASAVSGANKTKNNYRTNENNSKVEVSGESVISVAEEIKKYSNNPVKNEETATSASLPSRTAEVKSASNEEAVKDLTTATAAADAPFEAEEEAATGETIPEAALEPAVNEIKAADVVESDTTSPTAPVELEVTDNKDNVIPMQEEEDESTTETPSKSSSADLESMTVASPVTVDGVPQKEETEEILANVAPSAAGDPADVLPQSAEVPGAVSLKEIMSQPFVPPPDEEPISVVPTTEEEPVSIVATTEQEYAAVVTSVEEKPVPVVSPAEKEPVVVADKVSPIGETPTAEESAATVRLAVVEEQQMKKIDVKVLLAVHVKQSDGDAVMQGRGKSILESIIGVTERIVKETLEENRENPPSNNIGGNHYAFQQALYKNEHRPYIETVNIDSGFANAPKGIVRLVVREVVCIFEPKSVTKRDAGEVIGAVAEALRHSVANGRFAKEAKALRKAMKQQQKLN
jgi:hypothetical protein